MEENNFTSESINEIAAALSQFQGAVAQPTYNKSVNYGQTRFRYADLAECQRVTRKPLADAGLAVTQTIENGMLVTRLLHKSGQYITSQLPMSIPNKMQELGSMLTYMKRYTYCAILGIAADDDDDANIYDNTGKVAETITKTSPTPKPGDKPAKKAKGNDAIADAVLNKTYEDDLKEAMEAVKNAPSIEAVKGIYDSVAEAMRKDPRFVTTCTLRKNELI